MGLSQKTSPLLSICIPTFNRRKYLKECLDSIITQEAFNEQDIEIVISDNASEDDTTTLVKEYMDIHPNIVYHRNEENIGADRNVLKILGYGKGRFLWLLSDDDLILPGKLKIVLHELQKWKNQNDVAFFQANFHVLNADGVSYDIVNYLGKFGATTLYGNIHKLYKSYRYRHNGLSYLSIDIFSNEIQSFNLSSIPVTNFPHSCVMGLISHKKALFIGDAIVGFRQHNATGDFSSPSHFFKVFVVDFLRYMSFLRRHKSKVSQFQLSIMAGKMTAYSGYLWLRYFLKK